MLCWRGCRCLYEEYAQRGSNGLFRICSERGFSWHFLYSDLFVIFTGNLMFRTFFSCFRWKVFTFSSSVRVSAHVLQLYSSMDFTRDLTLSVPQAVKCGSQILTFCTPSRETWLANKRLECESTIGR